MRLMKRLAAALALSVAMLSPALPQGFALPNNTVVNGHLLAGGPPPTVTNGTLKSGSSDMYGAVTNTAGTTMVLTFGTPFTSIPIYAECSDTTTAEPVICVVTATTITFSGYKGGDVMSWFVLGLPGS